MAKLVGLLPRSKHSGDGTLIQRSDVDIQPAADGGDLHGVLRIVRHDGRSAAGQQHIGAVVDGDIVRNVVDQRGVPSDILKNFFKHRFYSFSTAKIAVEALWPPLTPEHGFPSLSYKVQGAPPRPAAGVPQTPVSHPFLQTDINRGHPK